MVPTERARFMELVGGILRAYSKQPSERDFEDWWDECRGLSIDALQSALKAHRDDPDRGEKAPRPIDITRRMKAGNRDNQRCAARDHTDQCEYPGIFSDGTMGEGPWYCPWHRTDRGGPEASRWIQISREVDYATAHAKRVERMHAESIRSPAVVETSHAIAIRHRDRPWQSKPVIDFPGEAA